MNLHMLVYQRMYILNQVHLSQVQYIFNRIADLSEVFYEFLVTLNFQISRVTFYPPPCPKEQSKFANKTNTHCSYSISSEAVAIRMPSVTQPQVHSEQLAAHSH